MTEQTTSKSISQAVKERQENIDLAEEQFLSDMEELLPTYIEDGGSMADLIKLTGLSQPKVYSILKELDLKFPRRGKTFKYNEKERKKIAEKVFKQDRNITKVAAEFDLSEQQVRAYGKEFGLYQPRKRQSRKASGRLKVADTVRESEREHETEDAA